MSTTFSLGETLRLRFLKDTLKTDFVEESVLLTHFMRLRPFFYIQNSAKRLSVYWKPNAKQIISQLGIIFFAMVYAQYVIREMFQETYVIRDLNENGLVIRDRDPPPFTTLYS